MVRTSLPIKGWVKILCSFSHNPAPQPGRTDSCKEGCWEEELVHHQPGGDQRIHHQHSQAHPWNGFQELCPSGHSEKSWNLPRGSPRCIDTDTRISKAVWTKGKGMSRAGFMCFPGDAVIKNPPANAGDATEVGSIPGSGRSPGGGHGNPLQDSCLGNPMDRGAWRATVHGVAKSWTGLSNRTHTHTHFYLRAVVQET